MKNSRYPRVCCDCYSSPIHIILSWKNVSVCARVLLTLSSTLFNSLQHSSSSKNLTPLESLPPDLSFTFSYDSQKFSQGPFFIFSINFLSSVSSYTLSPEVVNRRALWLTCTRSPSWHSLLLNNPTPYSCTLSLHSVSEWMPEMVPCSEIQFC